MGPNPSLLPGLIAEGTLKKPDWLKRQEEEMERVRAAMAADDPAEATAAVARMRSSPFDEAGGFLRKNRDSERPYKVATAAAAGTAIDPEGTRESMGAYNRTLGNARTRVQKWLQFAGPEPAPEDFEAAGITREAALAAREGKASKNRERTAGEIASKKASGKTGFSYLKTDDGRQIAQAEGGPIVTRNPDGSSSVNRKEQTLGELQDRMRGLPREEQARLILEAMGS